MGRVPIQQADPYYYNIMQQDISLAFQPYVYTFRPTVATPAGGTDVIRNNVTYRDFIWTEWGWTTDQVFAPVFWWPAVGVPFRALVRDINASKNFGDQRIDLTALTGSNPQWNDKGMYKLPVPWRFLMNTTIQVEIENIGLVPSVCTILLGGFYANTAR